MSDGSSVSDPGAERYNRECRCVTLDKEVMRAELMRQPEGAELCRMLLEERPHLFAASPVFVPEGCIRRQAQIVAAVERVVALPAYRERALAHAPAAARFAPRARGVFLGYDFHLSAAGPRLIEINTNAGGALLNALLRRVQRACGESGRLAPGRPAEDEADAEQGFLAMFRDEWRLERGDAPLSTLAIVDDAPESQFLLPEFLLFRNLFRRNGIDAVICDPSELRFRDGAHWRGERRIDFVYNRLTDFGLAASACSDLRAAYLAGAVVVSPHPHAHALYADKRNLVLLTDEGVLRDLGVDEETREILLAGVARTTAVRAEDGGALWAARKHLFFKPASGYGSKAAYRGDKLTRRVFEEILGRGDFVAQALVLPSERYLNVDDRESGFKLDIRLYVYQGRVQLVAARLYQGQTTNFRTPGGGFAPVIVLPSVAIGPAAGLAR
ncbi:hypothetical protein JWZ97_09325 [Methylococcus sp. EFPC2]|nr:hypothetical protein JWZ97_09325 [Methylococcus sp. EFPC2]